MAIDNKKSAMKQILICDDSRLSRKMISDIIKPLNLNIIYATNGKEAMSLISSQKVDCILLDLLMPEMDGFEVLSNLNKAGISTPVIVISSDVQDTTRQKCLSLGAFNLLNKPPKEGELIKALQTIMVFQKEKNNESQ